MYNFLPWDTPCLAEGHIFFLIWRLFNHKKSTFSQSQRSIQKKLWMSIWAMLSHQNQTTCHMIKINNIPRHLVSISSIKNAICMFLLQMANRWRCVLLHNLNHMVLKRGNLQLLMPLGLYVIYGRPPCHLWMSLTSFMVTPGPPELKNTSLVIYKAPEKVTFIS